MNITRNIRHVVGRIVVLVGVAFSLSLVAQAGAVTGPASEIIPPPLLSSQSRASACPRKRSLAIPIAIAPLHVKPAPSIECVVTAGPEIPISALAFTSDGKMLAVGGYQEVLIWDLANAKLLKRVGAAQITGLVHALTFLKDDRLLVVGEGTPHSSGAVRVFDIETDQQTLILQEPAEGGALTRPSLSGDPVQPPGPAALAEDVIYALALSPDGKLLAAGGADNQVYVWSLPDNKLTAVIKEHSGWVLGVSFSPDGKLLATSSADKTVQVWQVGTWSSVAKMQQQDTVQGSVFSHDGRLLAVAVGGPNDKAIRIQRSDNARQTSVMYTGSARPLDIIWTPKPNRIYVSCSDKTVKVFDVAKRRLVGTFCGHADWVYAIALSPDGTRLASGSADGTVKLWSVNEARAASPKGWTGSEPASPAWTGSNPPSAARAKPWTGSSPPSAGRLLATLLQLSPRMDDWLIITEQGYLATSSTSALQWRITNLASRPDELTNLLQNPEAVGKVLAGEKVEPPPLRRGYWLLQ